LFFCPGNVGANELLTSLMQSVDVFSEHQASNMRDEEERAAREMIKTEQDRAYQASLAVDRYFTKLFLQNCSTKWGTSWDRPTKLKALNVLSNRRRYAMRTLGSIRQRTTLSSYGIHFCPESTWRNSRVVSMIACQPQGCGFESGLRNVFPLTLFRGLCNLNRVLNTVDECLLGGRVVSVATLPVMVSRLG